MILGRWGGEKFASLFQNVSSTEEIRENFINFQINLISDLHKTLIILYYITDNILKVITDFLTLV